MVNFYLYVWREKNSCVQTDHKATEVCLKYFAFTFKWNPISNAETENLQLPHEMLNGKELINTCRFCWQHRKEFATFLVEE